MGAIKPLVDIDFARPYFGDEEREAVNAVMAGHWLANGPRVEEFEAKFASVIGVPYALSCNSGSSANLLALASLDLPKGSKVLTSGCGFPATLAPILHLGLEPVLVDYETEHFNADLNQVEDRIGGCKAVILAHTMGNPLDLSKIAPDGSVAIVEDCCEALGARVNGVSGRIERHRDIQFLPFSPDYRLGWWWNGDFQERRTVFEG